MKPLVFVPVLLCLTAAASTAHAWCGEGTVLLVAWVEADNIATQKEADYQTAKQAYEQAESTWRGWQEALRIVEGLKDAAGDTLADHDRGCNQCRDLGERCGQGQTLYDNYRSLVVQTDQAAAHENAAYEAYCQAYQAKFEAQTEWNEAEMNLTAAIIAYWAHVNGPPPCPDCNQ